jgi:spore coat polysaccharide biosynthesis predicted glycosyltransferase SpsG
LIVFFTSLSREIGVGNAIRTISIAIELKRDSDPEQRIVVIDPDDLLRSLDLPVIEVKRHASASAARHDLRNLAELSMNQATLVTDLPGMTQQDSTEFRGFGFSRLVHLCIPGCQDYESDLFVSGYPGDLPMKPKSESTINGVEFLTVRPEVLAARPPKLLESRSITNVLIAMGGTDPNGNTRLVLTQLLNLGVQVSVILGPGSSICPGDNFLFERVRTYVSPNKATYVSALKSHGLVLTQGGLTANEAMCLGVSVICVKLGKNSTYLESLEKEKMVTLFDPATQDLETLITRHSDSLSRNRILAFDLVDGLGASRIARLI